VYSIRYSCQVLIKLGHTRHISEKYSNIKVHDNSTTECPVVPCGQKERRADMTKLAVGFRNFAKAHKNHVP
jgi:hypothetical protein